MIIRRAYVPVGLAELDIEGDSAIGHSPIVAQGLVLFLLSTEKKADEYSLTVKMGNAASSYRSSAETVSHL